MKVYQSIKELQTIVEKITDINELIKEYSFISSGETYNVQFIGEGSAMGQKELSWISNNGAANLRVEFTGSGKNITVTNVKVNKYSVGEL